MSETPETEVTPVILTPDELVAERERLVARLTASPKTVQFQEELNSFDALNGFVNPSATVTVDPNEPA